MIYTATFCTMDQELGSNPLWHTCLLLSRYDEKTKKMEVIENWGFGGVPSTTPYSIIRKIKVNLGMDTDFYGNHGMLYEELRRLERGRGLHGATFELTQEKFLMLQQKCNKMLQDQNDAIAEAARDLKLQPYTGVTRNYPYEHESHRIYEHELKRAQEEKRPARLHEFSLSLTEPRTCKTQILRLLEGVITPKQIERISGWHAAVSRLSGKMESIYLHSAGPLSQHKRRSGDIAHYRQASDAKLYWSLPPQEIEPISDHTRSLFKIHDEYCAEVKLVIRQLQALEWFFRDAKLADIYSEARNKLVQHIVSLYEAFAIIEPKKSLLAKNDWTSFWRWLSSQPRDVDEKILMDKLTNAKNLFNTLYSAVVDDWDLAHDFKRDKAEDLEILAAYLPINQQKELCRIIGRDYLDTPDKLEFSSADEVLSDVGALSQDDFSEQRRNQITP